MKRSLSRAASAVGAAIILSTVGPAGPAQATDACWNTSVGTTCRDYGESAAGRATVRAAEHPTFAGILKIGQILTSTPGVWLGAGGFGTDALKYQWLRDGVIIPGAVGETYEITESDDGRSLALRVTASDEGVKDGVETTLPSPRVSGTNTTVYTARPGITGDTPAVWGWTRVGATLEVSNLGTWSPNWMTVRLQWQAGGVDIAEATSNSYTIRAADLGKTVTLKVTGTSVGVPSVSMSNTATAVTPGFIHPPSEMWLSGGDRVGNTLSVEPLQWWSAGGELITFLYQWERDGQAIAGATASTYAVVAADSGHQIRAKVTATAPGYAPNTQTSLYTDVLDADGGRGEVDPSGQPAPVPAPGPEPAPVPDHNPAPAEEESPASTAGAPAPQAPAPQSTAVQPLARTLPARKFLAPPAGSSEGQRQAVAPVQAAAVGTAALAETAAAPTEPAAADPVPAATASPSPSPSGSSGPAATATQADATGTFNPVPAFFTIAGGLIAAGLLWVIRPLRASALRLVGRKVP